MESRYITSAAKAEQLPEFEVQEVAFLGRSNAGKSTLLNAIMGRRSLARAGRTPGLTKMVNFFSYGEKRIFADLPGYGYHAAHYDIAKDWDQLVTAYMRRPNIQFFVFLMDCRRKINDEDQSLIEAVSKHHPLIITLTKADKINRSERNQAKVKVAQKLAQHGIEVFDIITISSTKNIGIETLKKHLLGN